MVGTQSGSARLDIFGCLPARSIKENQAAFPPSYIQETAKTGQIDAIQAFQLVNAMPASLADPRPGHRDVKQIMRRYLNTLQPLARCEARMGDLIGNNEGNTNSPCRLQTTSENNAFTGFVDFTFVLSRIKTMPLQSSFFQNCIFGPLISNTVMGM